MGTPTPPAPAALVASVLFREEAFLEEALSALGRDLGPGRRHPEILPFDQSDYYHAEMGAPLRRALWMADAPVGRDTLADIKLRTNAIESRLKGPGGGRRVNVDPGILSAENFILATTKNYAHRVYLRDGIFADLTLIYRDGAWHPLPWTYPDYAGPEIRKVLKLWRDAYMKGLRIKDGF